MKDSLYKRSKKIAGQVEGINKMLKDNRSCEDILQQVVAARAALASFGVELIINDDVLCSKSTDKDDLKKLLANYFKVT